MKNLIVCLLLVCVVCLGTAQAQHKIAIGYAYKKMDGNCGQFTTAVGYRYDTSSSDETTLGDLRQSVTEDLKDRFSVSSSNIQVWTAKKDFGCIIIYTKKISGWDCYKTSYAAGFGDTQYEAEKNAIKEMRLYYSGTDYKVETYINW